LLLPDGALRRISGYNVRIILLTRFHSVNEITSTNIPVFDFGGTGPLINLAVANGFPPQTYSPMMRGLLDQHSAISVLPRALWNPAPAPETLTHWRQKADDLLAGLAQRNLTDVIAMGHSMGGVASMLAVVAQPQRFWALVLLDPTFLPPPALAAIGALRALGQGHRFPLAQGARRRRDRFESTEAAYAYWRQRRLFAQWPDETVRLYAESMTRPAPDGEGVVLTWSKEWEARYYERVITEVWGVIGKLRGLLPVLAVRGTETDTFTAQSCRKFRRMVPDATIVEIEGHGHLFPQSAPDETARIVREWLEARGL
jgi:pimeloyl-ACP methyl ester carboxylesterase